MSSGFLRGLAAALFGVAIAVTPSSAAAPLENIQGEYAGTLKSKNQVIDPQQEESGSDTSLMGLVVNQEGTSTSGTLVVFGEGTDEDIVVSLDGAAGNGKFHFSGSNGEGSLFLVGAMKGAEGKRVLKAKGAFLAGSHYSDIKVSLKEGPSGIEL